jgi:hypothetical protein
MQAATVSVYTHSENTELEEISVAILFTILKANPAMAMRCVLFLIYIFMMNTHA